MSPVEETAPEQGAEPGTIEALLRMVPDFPQPGIRFWDLAPVFADGAGLAAMVDLLAAAGRGADAVMGIEARGFLLGSAVAHVLGVGVVPVRKPGKLPAVAASVEYELEYGTATLELPSGALAPGARVFVVDDVLATGGTVAAACELTEKAGAVVDRIGVVIEIDALDGRSALGGRAVHSLLHR